MNLGENLLFGDAHDDDGGGNAGKGDNALSAEHVGDLGVTAGKGVLAGGTGGGDNDDGDNAPSSEVLGTLGGSAGERALGRIGGGGDNVGSFETLSDLGDTAGGGDNVVSFETLGDLGDTTGGVDDGDNATPFDNLGVVDGGDHGGGVGSVFTHGKSLFTPLRLDQSSGDVCMHSKHCRIWI